MFQRIQKMDLGRRGGGEGLVGVVGWENFNQNILYENCLSSIKEKKKKQWSVLHTSLPNPIKVKNK